MFKSEYERYLAFIGRYYPETGVQTNSTLQKIHACIHKNIRFMKIIEEIEKEVYLERKKLYEGFYLIHLRALYHLASNDEVINNIIVRLLSENILRLAVSYINPQTQNITGLSYLEIKDNLKSKGFPSRYPDLYQVLTSNYGKYSQDIHGETIHKFSESEYLVMIRSNADTAKSIEGLFRVYDNITDKIIPFFLAEGNFKKKEIESSVLSRILGIVGEDVYHQYF